mmetsp:Transcript_23099/g.19391  ORF Transcript_23099/g.19391 Transcript_23099/m.19391 type:complete len:436 (+) Transcript_23099:94-1401(+)
MWPPLMPTWRWKLKNYISVSMPKSISNASKSKRALCKRTQRQKSARSCGKKKKKIIPGADFLESVPHAPWPSRSMLKRRVVLGTPADLVIVKNGVARVLYPSGAVYEGEVRNGKRHGNGMFTWFDGESYQGMWYMGLPHGLGVAEFTSGAAYCGEWYLGDRHGYGMYFFTEHPDEPHKEFIGQWRNDTLYGVGKRLSKDGSLYLGNWKRGLKHGDGIARVCHATVLDPVGLAANVARKISTKGNTGRYSKIDATQKREIDLTQVMGGIKDWRAEAFGIVVQEGRFVGDEFEPRDKHEIKSKVAKLEKQRLRDERMAAGDDDDDNEEEEEEEEEDPYSKAAQKRRQRQARLRRLVQRDGVVLASKNYPKDLVDWQHFETFIQVGMETSDASELVAEKVRAKFHKVNFNFRVTHFEKHSKKEGQHAVTEFDRENAYT